MNDWQPMNDGVLVQRIEKPIPQGKIVLTDEKSANGPILAEGVILAVGPGKWVDGTWWCFQREIAVPGIRSLFPIYGPVWEWIPGHREQLDVKPGMTVLFNARWNDFANQELRGTDCDGCGPLERPLSYHFDPTVHLIQENDIAGLLG